jgi:hypothetical protein
MNERWLPGAPPIKTRVILNPGFSRVKDLARTGTGLWFFGALSMRVFLPIRARSFTA